MNTMTEDDIRLLAYVDGELSPAEHDAVAQAVAASPTLARAVAQLQASRLPYREAFAAQPVPPVPDSLTRQLEAMLQARAKRDASAADHPAPHGPADAGAATAAMAGVAPPVAVSGAPVQMAPVSTAQGASNDATGGGGRRGVGAGWLVAAFAAGVAACAVTLSLSPGLLPRSGPAVIAQAPPTAQGVTWVRAAATYQQLYVRDTVASVTPDAAVTERTVAAIRQDDKLAIQVPDLSAQGLTFKHVQRLRWKDRALVQMVYLPAQGEPVALCVIQDMRDDAPVAEQRIDEMGVVTWRRGHLGYALIGAPGPVDLKQLARDIVDGDVKPLYGEAQSLQAHVAS